MRAPTGNDPKRPSFPRAPLIAAAATIGLTFAGILLTMDGGVTRTRPSGAPQLSRELRFEDTAHGAIRISDAATGAVVTELEPGQGGFVRATLRGLARERRLAAAPGPEAPFRLTAWTSGQLTLEDPATGRFVDLGAFGQTQRETFTAILLASSATSHGKLAQGTAPPGTASQGPAHQGGGLPR